MWGLLFVSQTPLALKSCLVIPVSLTFKGLCEDSDWSHLRRLTTSFDPSDCEGGNYPPKCVWLHQWRTSMRGDMQTIKGCEKFTENLDFRGDAFQGWLALLRLKATLICLCSTSRDVHPNKKKKKKRLNYSNEGIKVLKSTCRDNLELGSGLTETSETAFWHFSSWERLAGAEVRDGDCLLRWDPS